jgi:hypothetical protein
MSARATQWLMGRIGRNDFTERRGAFIVALIEDS